MPSFNDSWDFSTGLVAITGEVPFCQVGQTDRFPHGSGSDVSPPAESLPSLFLQCNMCDIGYGHLRLSQTAFILALQAVLKGCEVGADKPPGSLHPRFLQLADEYGRRYGCPIPMQSWREATMPGLAERTMTDTSPLAYTSTKMLHPPLIITTIRLRGYILQHMKERRRQVPVEKDRLTLHAAEMTTDIDWGNFGEDGELDGNWPSSGDGRRGSSNYSGQALAGFTESTGKQLAVVVTGRLRLLLLSPLVEGSGPSRFVSSFS